MMIQKLKIIPPGPQIYIGLDLALRGDQDKSVDLAPKGHSLWARRQTHVHRDADPKRTKI